MDIRQQNHASAGEGPHQRLATVSALHPALAGPATPAPSVLLD